MLQGIANHTQYHAATKYHDAAEYHVATEYHVAAIYLVGFLLATNFDVRFLLVAINFESDLCL